MKINELFSRDVLIREAYRVFSKGLSRLYCRFEYGSRWREAVFSRYPSSLSDFVFLAFYSPYDLFFSVSEFEAERCSFLLIDVDVLDPRVFDAVVRMVSLMTGLESKDVLERVPKYVTSKGFHFVLRVREPVDRWKMRSYVRSRADQFLVGRRRLSFFVDYSVADARFLRVPFTPVSFGDVRRVVPIPKNGDLSRALRWQYSVRSDPMIVTDVYEEYVFIDRDEEKALRDVVPRLVGDAGLVKPLPLRGVLPPCLLNTIYEVVRKYRAGEKPYLSHEQRLFIAVLLKHIFKDELWKELGEESLSRLFTHFIMGMLEDYNERRTDYYFEHAYQHLEYGCASVRSMGLCPYSDREALRCPFRGLLWRYFLRER